MGVGAERLVLLAELVAGCELAEAFQIDNVERADVVGLAVQVLLPVTVLCVRRRCSCEVGQFQTYTVTLSSAVHLPETESLNVLATLAKGRVAIRCTLQVHIDKLKQIRAHNLIMAMA